MSLGSLLFQHPFYFLEWIITALHEHHSSLVDRPMFNGYVYWNLSTGKKVSKGWKVTWDDSFSLNMAPLCFQLTNRNNDDCNRSVLNVAKIEQPNGYPDTIILLCSSLELAWKYDTHISIAMNIKILSFAMATLLFQLDKLLMVLKWVFYKKVSMQCSATSQGTRVCCRSNDLAAFICEPQSGIIISQTKIFFNAHSLEGVHKCNSSVICISRKNSQRFHCFASSTSRILALSSCFCWILSSV